MTAHLTGALVVGLDVETTGLCPRTDRVRLLSLAVGADDGTMTVYLIDCQAVDPAALWGALADKELVVHNAAFDLTFLGRLGFTPAGKVRDTMLLSQILAAGTIQPKGYHGLDSCLQRELGVGLDKSQQQSDWSLPSLSPDQLRYAAADVEHLRRLHLALADKIKRAGLERVADVEGRCLLALVWLAQFGVPFDQDAWLSLAGAAGAVADRLCRELNRAAPARPDCPDAGTRAPKAKQKKPDAWNWNSPAQVKQALALAGCVVESTADATLASVEHPLAQLLRRYRAAKKRSSTYGRDWMKHVSGGRVFCSWRQLGAKTGRMSSGAPNMQNLPREAAYRRCFAAPPGRVLVKADYSQIELRIAAKVAGERHMIDAYLAGEDLHVLTARQLTGREEVTKEERQLAKPINFGLIYGLGAGGLMRKARSEYGVAMTEQQAEQYRRTFFAAWPGIARWHKELKGLRWRQMLKREPAEVRTLSGRRVVVEPDFWHGGRANYVVQGTGGDGIKLALALLWERRDDARGAVPVLAVHDEIVVECDADQAGPVSEWLTKAMKDAMAPLIDPVPVEVEVKMGRTWGGD